MALGLEVEQIVEVNGTKRTAAVERILIGPGDKLVFHVPTHNVHGNVIRSATDLGNLLGCEIEVVTNPTVDEAFAAQRLQQRKFEEQADEDAQPPAVTETNVKAATVTDAAPAIEVAAPAIESSGEQPPKS